MTTTASGPITTTEALLKTTLSGLAAFRTWVGATDSVGAAEHIYLEALPPDELWADTRTVERLKSRRPFAQIWTAETDGFRVIRDASPTGRTASGTLIVRLECNVPAAVRHDYAEVDRLFKNDIGDILDDLMEDSSMAITSVSVSGPVRTSPADVPALGDAQMCELTIMWGVTQ